MDKAAALILAQQYADLVRANYELTRIYLFGSYIRGNYTEDSDIDIAVVLKDYKNLVDVQLELMKLRRKIDSRIEPHPFREREFSRSNPIVNEIMNYGQEIVSQIS